MRMCGKGRTLLLGLVVWLVGAALPGAAVAQRVLHLTLDKAVEIAMRNSYDIKQLELGIQRRKAWLRAQQAGLKSRVYMQLWAPRINAVSEYKWNSLLHRDEIVRTNTRLWQAELSVRQPVIIFGYPTNGYLSLNYKTYRYWQKDGGAEVNYYNRYFVAFEQPLFQPNTLKNNIEHAEADLQEAELRYLEDRVRMIDNIADSYYRLFQMSYLDRIYGRRLQLLRVVQRAAEELASSDTTRRVDLIQVRVEIANTRDRIAQNRSDLRMAIADLKQRLRARLPDSVVVDPAVDLRPVQVTLDDAVDKGFKLNPRLRILALRRRQREIELENTKGWNAFRVNLEMTYGLEREDDRFGMLFHDLDKSYSVSANAYLPLWDWGQRKARIEARAISVKQADLMIEAKRHEIRSDVANAVTNLKEYQQRALNMQKNLEMARQIAAMNLERYRQRQISLQDMLQNVNQVETTEQNFLDAYLGYRRSLLKLMVVTYYDYEKNATLLDLFLHQE